MTLGKSYVRYTYVDGTMLTNSLKVSYRYLDTYWFRVSDSTPCKRLLLKGLKAIF